MCVGAENSVADSPAIRKMVLLGARHPNDQVPESELPGMNEHSLLSN